MTVLVRIDRAAKRQATLPFIDESFYISVFLAPAQRSEKTEWKCWHSITVQLHLTSGSDAI